MSHVSKKWNELENISGRGFSPELEKNHMITSKDQPSNCDLRQTKETKQDNNNHTILPY